MINLFNSKILEDSAGTRWFMELGQIHEARALILAQGAVKLGPITPEDQARIEAIDDLSRLEALSLRLLSVATWAELLAPETTT